MRPVKLIMSGFGPYAKTEEVNFEAFGGKGIFLITGKTGSGKTSIFDALTYALYDSPSGTFRKNDMLRSRYSTPDDPTEVELYFRQNEKEYRIKRNPEYIRTAKRGGGTAKQKPEVELELPDGEVITKRDEVNERIREIIGLDRQQFMQIAMIAQGDFQKVLHADSNERIKIFRDIFHTHKYRELQERLREKAQQAEKALEVKSNEMDVCLQRVGFDTLEHQAEADTLAAQLEEFREEHLFAAEIPELIEDFVKLQETEREEIAAQENTLTEETAGLQRLLEKIEERRSLSEELEEAKKSLELKLQEQKEAEENEQQAKERLTETGALEQETGVLESQLELYGELDRQRDVLSDLEEKTAALQNEVTISEETLKQLEQQIDAAEAEEKKLEKAGENKVKLEAERDKAADALTRALALQDSLDQLTTERERRKEACEAYKVAARKATQANEDYARKNRAFLDGQAGLLAGELETGMPCPVCGSTEHPDPAARPENVPSEKELQRAKKAYDEAASAEREASELAGKRAGKLETIRKQVVEEICSGKDWLETAAETTEQNKVDRKTAEQNKVDQEIIDQKIERIAAALPQIQGQYEEKIRLTQKAIKEEQQNEKRCAKLREEIPQQRAELENKRSALAAAREELAAKNSALEEMKKQLEKAEQDLPFGSKKEAEQQIDALKQQITEIKEAAETAAVACREIRQAVFKLKGSISEKEERLSGMELPEEDETKEQYRITLAQQQKVKGLRESLDSSIVNNKKEAQSSRNILQETEVLREQSAMINTLSQTASGGLKDQIKLNIETYVQATYFDDILARANERLRIMSGGQYEMVRRKEEGRRGNVGLDIDVIDHYEDVTRPAESLSGGESFAAALSLALGMSETIQRRAGGIRPDSLFLDEGFGSLDEESLELTMKALADLSQGDRLVGIISHVKDLQERIDRQIVVEKQAFGGSHIRIQGL